MPDNVNMVISINTSKLISTLFIDATYKTKIDPKDIETLKSKINEGENPLKGVDFKSEIVFFFDTWKDNSVKGLFFNITNEKIFLNTTLQKKNIIKAANKNRGVLIYLDADASQNTYDHYTAFANKLISNQHEFSPPPTDGVMDITFKGNKYSYIHDLELNIQLADEHLLINGSGTLENILPLKEIYMLKEPSNRKFFEVQSGKLPDSVFKHVDEVAQQVSLDLPEIASQQVLIYGISIENYNGSPLVLPKMDCILRFDSKIKLDSVINNIDKELTHIKMVGNHMEIGNIKYYYQQLSDNEIYFGVSKSPEIHKEKTRILPLTRGFPSAILDIEGEGILARIINLMPQIKNSKLFLKGVDYYDIHSNFVDDHHLKIVGEVRLKKGKMMSIGLAEFILKFLN